MMDELRQRRATPEQVEVWLRALNDSYRLAMQVALEGVNDQLLERTEPAGTA
jgi:hypothetical protein